MFLLSVGSIHWFFEWKVYNGSLSHVLTEWNELATIIVLLPTKMKRDELYLESQKLPYTKVYESSYLIFKLLVWRDIETYIPTLHSHALVMKNLLYVMHWIFKLKYIMSSDCVKTLHLQYGSQLLKQNYIFQSRMYFISQIQIMEILYSELINVLCI